MNFQEKLFEATADLRARAAALATAAVATPVPAPRSLPSASQDSKAHSVSCQWPDANSTRWLVVTPSAS